MGTFLSGFRAKFQASFWANGFLGLFVFFLGTPAGAELTATTDVSDSKVTVKTTAQVKYSQVMERLRDSEKLAEILKAPFITSVSEFSKTEKRILESTSKLLKSKTEKRLLIETANSQALAPSLLVLNQNMTECKVSSDCKNAIELVLTGPEHTYESVHEFDNPNLLRGSLVVTILATEASSTETEISFALDIQSRGYLDFFKRLLEKRIIKDLPSEINMKSAFAFWARRALSEVTQ